MSERRRPPHRDLSNAAARRAPPQKHRGGDRGQPAPRAESRDGDGWMSVASTILVVDDDPTNRDLITQQLAGIGDDILAAADGEAAVEQLRAGFPGAVIADVKMPRMDGLELLRHAREVDPDLPVILVTGYGDIAMAVQAIRDGAYDFIARPYDAERLREMTARALRARSLVLDNRALRAELQAKTGLDARLLGTSAAMDELRRTISAVSDTSANV